jgi:hypothetical protein
MSARRQTRPLGTGVSCTSLAILLFGDHVLLLHVDDAVTLGHFCLCSNKLIARTLIFVVVGYTLRLFCFSLLRFLYAGTNPQWSYVRDKNTVTESDGGISPLWKVLVNPDVSLYSWDSCHFVILCFLFFFLSSYSARSTSSTFDMPVEIRSLFYFDTEGGGGTTSFFYFRVARRRKDDDTFS